MAHFYMATALEQLGERKGALSSYRLTLREVSEDADREHLSADFDAAEIAVACERRIAALE